jgi:hypothetical protein
VSISFHSFALVLGSIFISWIVRLKVYALFSGWPQKNIEPISEESGKTWKASIVQVREKNVSINEVVLHHLKSRGYSKRGRPSNAKKSNTSKEKHGKTPFKVVKQQVRF